MIWRIRDRGTFAALRREPARARGGVRVRSLRIAGADDPPRVAYAVGRPVGNAVARNRLRRRLRAAVHHHRDLLCDGTAYLVGAGPRASAMNPVELARTVGSLLAPPDPPAQS
ncbi:MAG: ribonuclease P protein component [Actinomycetota bacterium]